jgi:hypothetical protein
VRVRLGRFDPLLLLGRCAAGVRAEERAPLERDRFVADLRWVATLPSFWGDCRGGQRTCRCQWTRGIEGGDVAVRNFACLAQGSVLQSDERACAYKRTDRATLYGTSLASPRRTRR